MAVTTLVSKLKRKISRFAAKKTGLPKNSRRNSAGNERFANDIIEGLRSEPKRLPSKYLYDSAGDELFKKITTLPEYYVTRCEEEILHTYATFIARLTNRWPEGFRLIELGPGDGKKTQILLKELVKQLVSFTYHPFDISENVLRLLQKNMQRLFPKLTIEPHAADYMAALEDMSNDQLPRFVLFMGGNIGNYTKNEAASFLNKLAVRMRRNDILLCGFDLKKDPAVIYHAYNDSQGVTRSFTFNLLRRINREMGADFSLQDFIHYPTYDPQTGAMKSYLISEKEQIVRFRNPRAQISFRRWEAILTEVSNKYDVEEIRQMCANAGFATERLLFDKKKYYVNVILKKE